MTTNNIENIKTTKKTLRINTEAEVIDTFKLNKLDKQSQLLLDWLNADDYKELDHIQQAIFNKSIKRAQLKIRNWSEEDLKMYFISDIIDLSNLDFDDTICALFDKKLETDVDGIHLISKPDFTIGKGIIDLIKSPYFHFHEYKKDKEASRDPLGQLLKAFLIGSEINQNGKPLYGAYIIGRYWYFVVYENNISRDYCVSPSYDSTKEHELLQIIAILRHFRVILETKLIID
ncbi:MAG: hypothetical protein RLZZ210_1808 [Pseudomonadota bacterium]|jgi:hypothetical protein